MVFQTQKNGDLSSKFFLFFFMDFDKFFANLTHVLSHARSHVNIVLSEKKKSPFSKKHRPFAVSGGGEKKQNNACMWLREATAAVRRKWD